MCSIRSSLALGSVTRSMAYSMPAQPPFLMPTRMPLASPPALSTIALTRSAAASVSVITAKAMGRFSFAGRVQGPAVCESESSVGGLTDQVTALRVCPSFGCRHLLPASGAKGYAARFSQTKRHPYRGNHCPVVLLPACREKVPAGG
nr:hypothetical protein SHINE37_41596 [Rhizobiaceae bacterium]